MSRGLGKMQLTILDSLEASRQWMAEPDSKTFGDLVVHRGKYRDHKPDAGKPLRVRVDGEYVELAAGQYDLSAVLEYLGEKDQKFVSSFWRAAKKLIETGHLSRVLEGSNRIVCFQAKNEDLKS